MISVVVTTHNDEAWIDEALSSVLRQTYGPGRLEVVVVDSGSSDRTMARCEALAPSFRGPFRVMSVPNEGPSRARNSGLAATTHPWVQFLDGDDVLHPRKLELQAAAAASADSSVATLYSAWARLLPADATWALAPDCMAPSIGAADPVADLLGDNFVQVGSQLFERNSLERVNGFDERHWLIEDVDLMLRLAMAGATFHRVESSEPLFFYRQRPGSLSRRDGAAFVEGCLRNARMVETHWRAEGALSQSRCRLMAEIHVNGARYWASRDRSRFEEIARHIESLVPGFVPSGPPRLRRAARVVGYRRAERLAAMCRQLSGA